LMLFGTGLAFYLGKPLIQPQAPQIPAIPLGDWSDNPVVRSALQLNALVPIGLLLAVFLWWGFARTRAGLLVRMAGDSANATRALGYSVAGIRIAATTAGGFIAGLGGASLTLFLSGQLERRHLQRAGLDRSGTGHLRALEPAAVCRRSLPLRRCRRHRAGAAIGRRGLGLPPLQHGALRTHAGDTGHHMQAWQCRDRQSWRVVFHALIVRRANPYRNH
jgi:hypothetical protein